MKKFPEGLGKAVLLMASFLSLLGLTQILYLVFPSAIWSVISLLIFGGYVLAMASLTPISFLLLLPYIFFRATSLLSGIAIEYGGYMADFSLAGEPTGAYIRLTAVYIIFVSFASLVIEWLAGYIHQNDKIFNTVRDRTRRHPWVWIFYAIFVLFSLYVIGVGLKNGFPFFTGLDRLAFREELGGRAYIFYMSNRMLAAYLFGIVIFLCQGMRRYMGIFLFLSMIAISILFGEKFASLMLITIYGITPAYLISKELRGRILQHVLPAISVTALLTIPVIMAVYGWPSRTQEALDKISTRIVGQGEIWYVADKDTKDLVRINENDISYLLGATLNPNPEETFEERPYMGVWYFMHNYMDPVSLKLFLKRTSLTLTLGFEPYLLVAFGWLGMLLPLCFYAGIYALSLLYLAWGIQNARSISIFAAGKLIIWIVIGLSQGALFMIFGLKMLILVASIIVYELISAHLSRKRAGA